MRRDYSNGNKKSCGIFTDEQMYCSISFHRLKSNLPLKKACAIIYSMCWVLEHQKAIAEKKQKQLLLWRLEQLLW